MTTRCGPMSEPGEAKASDSTASTTSLVLAWTMAIAHCRSLHRRRFVMASRHRPIAFDSEGLPLGQRQSLNNPG